MLDLGIELYVKEKDAEKFAATKLVAVKGAPATGQAGGTVETTTSSDPVKVYIPDRPDTGDMDYTYNYSEENYTAVKAVCDNTAKSILIKYPDGTVITGRTRFESYLTALKSIGLDKIKSILPQLKYQRLNCPVISTEKYNVIENNTQRYSYVEEEGYYIIKGINGKTMRNILLKISEILDLKLEVGYQCES